MIELKNEFGRIYYQGRLDKENGWIHTMYTGFLGKERGIEGVKATLQLLKTHSVSKLLSDNSQVKGTWSDANDWIDKHWFTLAPKYGLQKHATVVTRDTFAKVSHEHHEKKLEESVIVTQSFTNIKEAKEWLRAD